MNSIGTIDTIRTIVTPTIGMWYKTASRLKNIKKDGVSLVRVSLVALVAMVPLLKRRFLQ